MGVLWHLPEIIKDNLREAGFEVLYSDDPDVAARYESVESLLDDSRIVDKSVVEKRVSSMYKWVGMYAGKEGTYQTYRVTSDGSTPTKGLRGFQVVDFGKYIGNKPPMFEYIIEAFLSATNSPHIEIYNIDSPHELGLSSAGVLIAGLDEDGYPSGSFWHITLVLSSSDQEEHELPLNWDAELAA